MKNEDFCCVGGDFTTFSGDLRKSVWTKGDSDYNKNIIKFDSVNGI